MNQRFKTIVVTAMVTGFFAAISCVGVASAVPVDPPVKTCLDKLIGSKATNALISAKKLSKTQTAQVAKCKKSAATSTASPGWLGCWLNKWLNEQHGCPQLRVAVDNYLATKWPWQCFRPCAIASW